MKNKISILIPTYNDAISIVETLNSVIKQTYNNWEVVIMDDGSTDNTKSVVEEYITTHNQADKIHYFYKKNEDQLNAILKASEHADGDFFFILHSDDLLASPDFLKRSIQYMQHHNDVDAIIGDLLIINDISQVTNRWRASKYQKQYRGIIMTALNDGCNIFGDVAFCRRSVFIGKIIANYVTWNTPFWIDFSSENNTSCLNIHNVDFPFIKYRIHAGNYANNPVGKFCALNGEIRTLVSCLHRFRIPFYGIQSAFYKFLRLPGIRRFRLFNYYHPLYRCGHPSKNIGKIIKNKISRVEPNYDQNIFLKSLVSFYENKNSRTINIDNIGDAKPVFQGKDIRVFANLLFSKSLPPFYEKLLKEMRKGFTAAIVPNRKAAKTLRDIFKFFCIDDEVKIIIKEN